MPPMGPGWLRALAVLLLAVVLTGVAVPDAGRTTSTALASGPGRTAWQEGACEGDE